MIKQSNLILLPGLGYHASIFQRMLPSLNASEVHCRDLPIISQANISDCLSEFAKSLPDSATVVGWSLGGLIAIELCKRFPIQFKKLVLLASSPRFTDSHDWQGITADNIENFATAISLREPFARQHFYKLVSFPSTAKSTRDHFALAANLRYDSLPQYLNYLIRSDLRADFAALTQPKIAIAGERDAILPPSPVTTHLVAGAGHALFHTHTESVCRIINQFAGEPS